MRPTASIEAASERDAASGARAARRAADRAAIAIVDGRRRVVAGGGRTPAGAMRANAMPHANAATSAGAAAIAANEPLRLRIAPSGPCWVRVSVDGEIRHQKLMQKGEVFEHEAKDGFEVLIGDAGTFRYTINDRPGRVIGESGDVDRRPHQSRDASRLAPARALTPRSHPRNLATVCGIR